VADGPFDASISVDGEVHTRAMIAATPLPHPRGFCSSPDGTRAAVPSEETDELLVVGESGPVQRIAVGDGPSACAFLDDGTLAVTHRWSSALWVLTLDGARAPRIVPLSGPLGELAFDAQAGRIIVARGGHAPALLSLSWPELELRGTSPLTAAVDHLLLGPHAGELIAATRADSGVRLLHRSDESYTPARSLHLGRAAAALARSRDGRRVYATVTDYRPDGTPQLGNHFVQDQLLVIDAESLQVRSRVFTARRSERQTKPGDVDQGGSPLGLFELRDGRLAMTMAGTDELWRYERGSDAIDAVQLRDSDVFTPQGVVELADGTMWLSSPAASTLARLRGGTLTIVSLAPAKLSHEARLRREGERAFYESTRSGISCQSCHMHAGSDDAAYNLGDHRLVPTLTVAGVAGTAPYLRDGSYPRIEDLDEVAQKLYRGYDRILPGRRAALQAFIEDLPRERSDFPRDRAAEKRGLGAFMKARCERCHALPAFTNLAQLPMAALFPTAAKKFPDDEVVDVPSLLSISTAPPYLNDGRAATLSAVIDDQNADNLHGDTRALSPQERADLIAFLRSL
jgi:hypothetical protein